MARQGFDRAGLGRLGQWAGAAVLALVALAVLWVPWRGHAPGRGAALEAPLAWAASVITGTVAWKGTETPVGDVRVVLKDPKAGGVVAEATTDAQGVFMLPSAGVGDWLVEVPSTGQYWGYAQTVTVFPHNDYRQNFGITRRPPEAPTPTALPQTPTPLPTVAAGAGTTPGAGGTGGKLPPSGRAQATWPADLALAGAALLMLLGFVLRRSWTARKEPC